ncbi:hypothetical protein ACQ33O_07775 [Ferruginibacter sp. SUN002]|uniref:hypothetical protein n=1 Tax=Ferruginibacter sp. SUN002 TaxID=2937789 RepID=UPI003D3687F8
MTDVLTNYDQSPPKRPTFLTVLCILTFIGSGWGLINGITQYFTAESQVAAMSLVKENVNAEMQKVSDANPGGKMVSEMVGGMLNVFTPENVKKMALAGILAAVLCLAGAFLMWGLKKKGFYSYIAGTLVGIITPFVLFGAGNLLAMGMSVMVGFIGLVFVILYGVNLKHMN